MANTLNRFYSMCFVCNKHTTYRCRGHCRDAPLCVGIEPKNVMGLSFSRRSKFTPKEVSKWDLVDCYFIWHNCVDWIKMTRNRPDDKTIFEGLPVDE